LVAVGLFLEAVAIFSIDAMVIFGICSFLLGFALCLVGGVRMRGQEHGLFGRILAIIGIVPAGLTIAFVLFIVFTPPRAADKSTCASNMRQIGISIQMYADDNGGKVPPGCGMAHGGAVDYSSPEAPLWPTALKPYVKKIDRLLMCPSVKRGQRDCLDPRAPVTSYGMNWRFASGPAGGDPDHQKPGRCGVTQKLDAPKTPSRTVLLIETQNQIIWKGKGPASWGNASPPRGGNILPYGDWGKWYWAIRWQHESARPSAHDAGCNVVCADTHVKFVRSPDRPFPPPDKKTDAPVAKARLFWW
jgi:hypothetical protein